MNIAKQSKKHSFLSQTSGDSSWLKIYQIKTLVGVPSDMRNVSEVGGPADVLLRQLLLVALLVLREVVVPSRLMQSSCFWQWCIVANPGVRSYSSIHNNSTRKEKQRLVKEKHRILLNLQEKIPNVLLSNIPSRRGRWKRCRGRLEGRSVAIPDQHALSFDRSFPLRSLSPLFQFLFDDLLTDLCWIKVNEGFKLKSVWGNAHIMHFGENRLFTWKHISEHIMLKSLSIMVNMLEI